SAPDAVADICAEDRSRTSDRGWKRHPHDDQVAAQMTQQVLLLHIESDTDGAQLHGGHPGPAMISTSLWECTCPAAESLLFARSRVWLQRHTFGLLVPLRTVLLAAFDRCSFATKPSFDIPP